MEHAIELLAEYVAMAVNVLAILSIAIGSIQARSACRSRC